MPIKVDLHLRSNLADDHRALGMVSVETPGAQLAPHQEISLSLDGRSVRAQITSLHRHGSHLPHVYADEMPADELV